jgi:hypothetical protein
MADYTKVGSWVKMTQEANQFPERILTSMYGIAPVIIDDEAMQQQFLHHVAEIASAIDGDEGDLGRAKGNFVDYLIGLPKLIELHDNRGCFV